MTKLQHLKELKAWAEKWLAVSEADLPGTLTHEKCLKTLEEVDDQLIDYLGVTQDANGNFIACYIE